MTKRAITLGSLLNAHTYDDASPDHAAISKSIQVTQPIFIDAPPVAQEDSLRLAELGGLTPSAVSVSDITNPTELGSYTGSGSSLLLAYEVGAGENRSTLYVWDSAVSGGANSPYVVAGLSGYWIAVGGLYNHDTNIHGDLIVTNMTAHRPVATGHNKELVSIGNIVPTIQTLTTGTLKGGTLSSVQNWADGNVVWVAELGATTPGLILVYTFENVSMFHAIGVDAYYTGSTSHWVEFQIYDYTNTLWRTLYVFDHSANSNLNYRYSDLPQLENMDDFISAGDRVTTRFYHPGTGNPAHDLYVGFVSIKGRST